MFYNMQRRDPFAQAADYEPIAISADELSISVEEYDRKYGREAYRD